MNITQRALSDIVPYPLNPRMHSQKQVDRIANSIKEFGFNQPIVVDEEGICIVGHGRLLAAKKLELALVPVVEVRHLSDAQKKAYRVLDNKLQNDSDWSLENLELELEAIEKGGISLGDWGLDELDNLFEPAPLSVLDDSDASSLPRETIIRRGDLIELGAHRLLCGDSGTDTLAFLANDTLDLIITDPPYGVSYRGKTEKALTIENDDLPEDELEQLFSSVMNSWLARAREGAAVYVSGPSGPLHLVFANVLKKLGIYRQQLIWAKDCMVLGHSDYHYKHEPIFYGWKPGKHTFINDRTKTSLLEFARPKRAEDHPTMKPLSLWAELIGNSTSIGETVGDPFLGSGTTLRACEQLGRRCRAVEISPAYCEVVISRYLNHCSESGKDPECKVNGAPYPLTN